MLAQRCMGWHLTSLGKSHLNSLTDMSNAFSYTKRETLEEANEQMFKGDFWMAQRLRNGMVFLQGHDGEFTFMVKHGLLMETSSWAFNKTFKRWKTSHQTPPSMMLSAPFAGMEGSNMDGSWSGFADDLFIKDEIPDHTAESANNAPSLDETLAEDRYKQNLRKLEIVPSIRRYGEQRRLTSLVPFGKILGRGLASRRQIFIQREQQNGNRVQAEGDYGELVGGFWFARSPWSHKRLIFLSRIVSAAITGIDAYAASPSELNKLDRKYAST